MYRNLTEEEKELKCSQAVRMFLGGINISKISDELHSYIKSHMDQIGCCVLWSRSYELCEILDRGGINRDLYTGKEVIITSGYELRRNKITPR